MKSGSEVVAALVSVAVQLSLARVATFVDVSDLKRGHRRDFGQIKHDVGIDAIRMDGEMTGGVRREVTKRMGRGGSGWKHKTESGNGETTGQASSHGRQLSGRSMEREELKAMPTERELGDVHGLLRSAIRSSSVALAASPV